LSSTVVMFQAQNRETINSTWKVAVSVKIIVTMSVTSSCFTKQHQNCKTKTGLVLRPTVSDLITGMWSPLIEAGSSNLALMHCSCLRACLAAYLSILRRDLNTTCITMYSNSTHVLHPYRPVKTDIPYQLRTRSHCMTLINKTKFLNDTDFIIRLLYKYSY